VLHFPLYYRGCCCLTKGTNTHFQSALKVVAGVLLLPHLPLSVARCSVETKEVRLRPKTDSNDLNTKLKSALKFLAKVGKRVWVQAVSDSQAALCGGALSVDVYV